MDGRSCSGSRDIKSISFEKLAMVRTFLKKPEGVDGSFEVRSGAGFDRETATTFSQSSGGHHDEVGPKAGGSENAELWKHTAVKSKEKTAVEPGKECGAACVLWKRSSAFGTSTEHPDH